MSSLRDLLPAVEASLRAQADRERAAQMSAYMRDQFEFLGINSARRKQVQKPAVAAAKGAEPDELLNAADWCWAQTERELHYVGMDLLRAGSRNLGAGDLERVRTFIERKPWWDTVDALAAHTVGAMVRQHRSLSPVMDAWVNDGDFWIARTAILHQLAWKTEMEPHRLFDYARRRGADTEFFIRKALGWALRTLARHEPDLVRQFVEDNRSELSGLTIREATKHLSLAADSEP